MPFFSQSPNLVGSGPSRPSISTASFFGAFFLRLSLASASARLAAALSGGFSGGWSGITDFALNIELWRVSEHILLIIGFWQCVDVSACKRRARSQVKQ